MDTLRIGVIGIGNMGSAHVARITKGEVNGMVLATVCDIDERKRTAASEALENVTDKFAGQDDAARKHL